MRITIHSGSIRSIVATDASGEAGMALAPKPGLLVGEIEVKPKIDVKDTEALSALAKRHRIATPEYGHRLVRAAQK